MKKFLSTLHIRGYRYSPTRIPSCSDIEYCAAVCAHNQKTAPLCRQSCGSLNRSRIPCSHVQDCNRKYTGAMYLLRVLSRFRRLIFPDMFREYVLYFHSKQVLYLHEQSKDWKKEHNRTCHKI